MSAYGIHRKVREAIVAGIFYPEDAAGLSARLGAALLEASGPATLDGSPRPVAILSPHAAFDYSCDVQAAAWSAVGSRRIDRIVIIAPLRREGGSVAYLPESEAFQTPLGDVEVDLGACADLESCNTLFVTNDIPHLESHAVEVQLPFMRYLFPEALLVPVLVSSDAVMAASLARALDVAFGDDMDRTLIVASSNLASSLVAADAARRSDDVVKAMEAMDWRRLAERADLPGATTLASAMATRALSGSTFRLLRRVDSRRAGAPASENVVQYAAAAWFGRVPE